MSIEVEKRRRGYIMRKIVISLLAVLTLVGCSVKEDVVKEPEKEQESLNGPDGNYKSTDVKGFQVEGDIIKIDYTFDSTKGITFASFAFQNGIAIPFSHTKDGEYRLSNNLVLPEENNSLSIYIKANSFKKGDEVKFGVGFLNNPDYLPEIEEYTRYNPLKQSISITAKAFVAEEDFISNVAAPKILKEVTWEKVSGDIASVLTIV